MGFVSRMQLSVFRMPCAAWAQRLAERFAVWLFQRVFSAGRWTGQTCLPDFMRATWIDECEVCGAPIDAATEDRFCLKAFRPSTRGPFIRFVGVRGLIEGPVCMQCYAEFECWVAGLPLSGERDWQRRGDKQPG